QHDLLVSIGADLFTLSLPGEVDPLPEGMPIVHLDINPWELGKNYPEKVAILGDPKATLPELTAALRSAYTAAESRKATTRLEHVKGEGVASLHRLHALAEASAARHPIHPLSLMQ